jgi:hypothetical protein
MKTKWIVLFVFLGIVVVAGISLAVWWFSKPPPGETLALVAANQAIIEDDLVATIQDMVGLQDEVNTRVYALETFRTITEAPRWHRTFWHDYDESRVEPVVGDKVYFSFVSDDAHIDGSSDQIVLETGSQIILTDDHSQIRLAEDKNWLATLTVEAATERGNMVVRPIFSDITGTSDTIDESVYMRIDAAGASNQGDFNSTQSISFAFSSFDPDRRHLRIEFTSVDETSPRVLNFVSLYIREM